MTIARNERFGFDECTDGKGAYILGQYRRVRHGLICFSYDYI